MQAAAKAEKLDICHSCHINYSLKFQYDEGLETGLFDRKMKNRISTILCWILTVSLVWLPLSVSAGVSLSSLKTDSKHCEEMVTDASSGLTGQLQKKDISTPALQRHTFNDKGCCHECGSNCSACLAGSSCMHNVSHASPFLIYNRYTFQLVEQARFSIGHHVPYLSQITSPDIRPPVI